MICTTSAGVRGVWVAVPVLAAQIPEKQRGAPTYSATISRTICLERETPSDGGASSARQGEFYCFYERSCVKCVTCVEQEEKSELSMQDSQARGRFRLRFAGAV